MSLFDLSDTLQKHRTSLYVMSLFHYRYTLQKHRTYLDLIPCVHFSEHRSFFPLVSLFHFTETLFRNTQDDSLFKVLGSLCEQISLR